MMLKMMLLSNVRPTAIDRCREIQDHAAEFGRVEKVHFFLNFGMIWALLSKNIKIDYIRKRKT